MADLRKIADKLGKLPSTSAVPCAPAEFWIDFDQILSRYPTVLLLCGMAICSVIGILFALSVLAFLVAARTT